MSKFLIHLKLPSCLPEAPWFTDLQVRVIAVGLGSSYVCIMSSIVYVSMVAYACNKYINNWQKDTLMP